MRNILTRFSADCTYDQPSNRRRNPAPQYIEALENRLQRAEALLRSVLPNVDLNDPNLDADILQTRLESMAKDPSERVPPPNDSREGPPNTSEKEAQLRSMIESTGQLDLDETGRWDFHGGSSGTVFIRRLREQFGGLLDGDQSTPIFPRIPVRPMPPAFDSPKSSVESPLEAGLPNTLDLPKRDTAKVLCVNSLSCGCALLRFVHQPSFYEMFDRIYDTPVADFGDEENRFLPLLYCTFAFGCMFHLDLAEDSDPSSSKTYRAKIDEG